MVAIRLRHECAYLATLYAAPVVEQIVRKVCLGVIGDRPSRVSAPVSFFYRVQADRLFRPHWQVVRLPTLIPCLHCSVALFAQQAHWSELALRLWFSIVGFFVHGFWLLRASGVFRASRSVRSLGELHAQSWQSGICGVSQCRVGFPHSEQFSQGQRRKCSGSRCTVRRTIRCSEPGWGVSVAIVAFMGASR